MNVEIKLCKKRTSYVDESGVTKRVCNFYVLVGTEYIPIQVAFFPNAKCEGRDPQYAGRCAVMEAVAELLPEKRKQEPKPEAAAKAEKEAGDAKQATFTSL